MLTQCGAMRVAFRVWKKKGQHATHVVVVVVVRTD
jgi:hypothetical protein